MPGGNVAESAATPGGICGREVVPEPGGDTPRNGALRIAPPNPTERQW
jgi:hypothetical protein